MSDEHTLLTTPTNDTNIEYQHFTSSSQTIPPHPYNPHRYCTNLHRRLLRRDKHAFFCLSVIGAILVSFVAFVLMLVFIPATPRYTLCNQDIQWKSIFNSIIKQGYPSANVTIHTALYNPNRFEIDLHSVQLTLYYKNTPFGYARLSEKQPFDEPINATSVGPDENYYDQNDEFLVDHHNLIQILEQNDQKPTKRDPVRLKKGSITDVFMDAIIEPSISHAIAMSTDYYNEELFIAVSADFSTTVFAFFTPKINYDATYEFDNIDVHGGGGENYCKCHKDQ